jgi:flagellar hook-associated protein 3 FlgL
MRVSTIGLTHQTLAGIQRAAAALQEATVRTQTGLKIARPSDDPHGASSVMLTSSALRALDQYGRNVSSATARLNMEEGVLSQVTNSLDRAKQLALQEASGTANSQTRLVAKAEIDQILSFAVQLANTRHQGEYLFGGDQSTSPPITSNAAPYSATPVTGQRQAQIAEGQYVPVTHNATDVFLDSNLLAALEELSMALGADDTHGIKAALTTIDSAHASVQNLLGEVGARSNQLDIAASNLQALDSTLQVFKADLQELDLEEAVTQLVARQNAYQAALLTTSRVMNLSLADYMR